jgi:hypothetical protein
MMKRIRPTSKRNLTSLTSNVLASEPIVTSGHTESDDDLDNAMDEMVANAETEEQLLMAYYSQVVNKSAKDSTVEPLRPNKLDVLRPRQFKPPAVINKYNLSRSSNSYVKKLALSQQEITESDSFSDVEPTDTSSSSSLIYTGSSIPVNIAHDKVIPIYDGEEITLDSTSNQDNHSVNKGQKKIRPQFKNSSEITRAAGSK